MVPNKLKMEKNSSEKFILQTRWFTVQQQTAVDQESIPVRARAPYPNVMPWKAEKGREHHPSSSSDSNAAPPPHDRLPPVVITDEGDHTGAATTRRPLPRAPRPTGHGCSLAQQGGPLGPPRAQPWRAHPQLRWYGRRSFSASKEAMQPSRKRH